MLDNWEGYATGMESRVTTGWFVRGSKDREGDIFPYVAVINQLRDYYGLPRVSGEYDLGVQQTNMRAYAKEKELETEIQKLKEDILVDVRAKGVSEEKGYLSFNATTLACAVVASFYCVRWTLS